MGDIGRRLYRAHFGRPELTTDDHVRELLRRAAAEVEEEHKFSLRFLWTEWSRVVDAWQLASWEEYRDVPRLGRKTRLSERQRAVLWSIFSNVSHALDERGLLTEPRLFGRLERRLAKLAHPPFEFCVVDEAQDIGVAELRFLAALGAARPDGLFFAGDLGQRIFQTPFSWRVLTASAPLLQLALHEESDFARRDIVVAIVGKIDSVELEAHASVEIDRRDVGGLRLTDQDSEALLAGMQGDMIHQSATQTLSPVRVRDAEFSDPQTPVPAHGLSN